MWMMMFAAWLVSLVGVAYFLAGSKRYRDADEADDLSFDQALAKLADDGRKSDVYYVGEASRRERSPVSHEKVA